MLEPVTSMKNLKQTDVKSVHLLVFFGENPEVHPQLGEKVACATISPHLKITFIQVCIQVHWYLPLW